MKEKKGHFVVELQRPTCRTEENNELNIVVGGRK
jgi:hypothetical protein